MLVLGVLLAAPLSPVGLTVLGPRPAAAQTPDELRRQAEQRLGRQLTDEEIVEMLRQSGLSPQQIRDRLEDRGFDPGAADRWLAVVEGRASEVPEGTSAGPILSVLAGTEAGRRVGMDTTRIGRIPPDSLRFLEPRRPPDAGPPVFGREIFRRATSQFRPVTGGPVPEDYRVGPGDQLVLVLTGAVEQAYELRVSREGWVVIPEVGRIFVSDRTMEELRVLLRDRLAESYASLTGEEPSTSFDLTLGELRTNQVFVVGEVERPGAYTVSSLATALTALYHAGGPTRNGSFREIRVNRGGETVREIDLYEYLVRGSAAQDLRLRQGDIVFVPAAVRRVEIQGPVTRPGIYGLREGEGLRDLVRYAGGVQPEAELRRVQIRRVLPPEQRAPGVDRSVLDVPVGDLRAGEGEPIPLRDGDRVHVFAIQDEAMNRVTVSGGVWRPGTYGATDSTRLWDVLEAAGGLLPDAFEGRAQIQRLQEDFTRRMIPVSLERTGEGEPAENPLLEGMDQIFVYARRRLREDRAVSIGGWVREPGVYPYVEGMTVADLVLRAGGLRTGVYTARAEVARPVVSQTRTDTITRRFEVELDSSLVFDASAPDGRRDGAGTDGGDGAGVGGDGAGGGAGRAPAVSFVLRNLDAVYVRRAPGFEPQRRVVVTGEVRFPGPYSIQTRQERLTDLIERAGGFTREAYPEGFQLWRADPRLQALTDTAGAREIVGGAIGDTAETGLDTLARAGPGGAGRGAADPRAFPGGRRAPGDTLAPTRTAADFAPGRRPGVSGFRTRVGVDLAAALEKPESPDNILVEPRDSIHVPGFVPTVDVRGAVGVETKVLYREGASVDYYIGQAGGFAPDAAEGKLRVRFANGEIATKRGGFLFFGGGIAEPDPGSEIFVPFKPEREGLNVAQLTTIITSFLGTIATVTIAATN